MQSSNMRRYREYDVVINAYEGATETINGVMHTLCVGIDVEFVVLNEYGPGGENPNVLVIGTPDAIERFDLQYNGAESILEDV